MMWRTACNCKGLHKVEPYLADCSLVHWLVTVDVASNRFSLVADLRLAGICWLGSLRIMRSKVNVAKIALITGITGQDGSYLAELLLQKGYEVHGIKRRSSLFNTDRIDHLYQDPHLGGRRFFLHYGDLSDSSSLVRIIQKVCPHEVYNLGAQSHVAVSFEQPEYTGNVDGLGTLRILEAIRILGAEKVTRFYQASTSELYGLVQQIPQTEKTPFDPRSPYAVA